MRADIAALRGFMIPEIASPRPGQPMRIEWMIAGFLSLLWLAGLGTYGMAYFGESAEEANFLDVIVYTAALVSPLMCLWCGAWVVRYTNAVRAETERLSKSVADLESAVTLASPASTEIVINSIKDAAQTAMKSEQARITTQIRNLADDHRKVADAMRQLLKARVNDQEAITTLIDTAKSVTTKAAQKAGAADEARAETLKKLVQLAEPETDQDPLPLEAPKEEEAPALFWGDINRALNFPATADDQDTFDAIRTVVQHRPIEKLLQRAESVLAHLAEEGIYMDDLSSTPTNPELWRNFADGKRGKDIDAMGTVRDPAAMALARGRLRNNPEFRETVLEFLRRFDVVLQEYLSSAKTTEIMDLADTRSGRAFQLLARVNGAFD